MMDYLEGCLDNISTAATQNVAKGGPLAGLAASLAISVHTAARRQQEIKCLNKQINALKKRGTHAASIGTLPGGRLVGTTVCTHCEAVGRIAPHRKNACSSDLRKMTDRKEWAQELMDKKGVA